MDITQVQAVAIRLLLQTGNGFGIFLSVILPLFTHSGHQTNTRSSTFTKYSEWIYPSNFAYPMPKAFMWYPGAELNEDSLIGWIDK